MSPGIVRQTSPRARLIRGARARGVGSLCRTAAGRAAESNDLVSPFMTPSPRTCSAAPDLTMRGRHGAIGSRPALTSADLAVALAELLGDQGVGALPRRLRVGEPLGLRPAVAADAAIADGQ